MEEQKFEQIIARALAIYLEAVKAGRHVYHWSEGNSFVISELPQEWKDTQEDVIEAIKLWRTGIIIFDRRK